MAPPRPSILIPASASVLRIIVLHRYVYLESGSTPSSNTYISPHSRARAADLKRALLISCRSPGMTSTLFCLTFPLVGRYVFLGSCVCELKEDLT